MPHKKNPDVFELIRAYGNQLQALPNTITMIGVNLMSGYHRDYQIVKEHLFPALRQIKECLEMTCLMVEHIEVGPGLANDNRFDYLYSVEEVNRLVRQGVPFRDAYLQVKNAIASGNFMPEKKIIHTHEGSIGNLTLEEIQRMMDDIQKRFDFARVNQAENNLLQGQKNI